MAYLVSVEVEEVPVVCVGAGLHAVLGDVVLVHVVASLSHVLQGRNSIDISGTPKPVQIMLGVLRHVGPCTNDVS